MQAVSIGREPRQCSQPLFFFFFLQARTERAHAASGARNTFWGTAIKWRVLYSSYAPVSSAECYVRTTEATDSYNRKKRRSVQVPFADTPGDVTGWRYYASCDHRVNHVVSAINHVIIRAELCRALRSTGERERVKPNAM